MPLKKYCPVRVFIVLSICLSMSSSALSQTNTPRVPGETEPVMRSFSVWPIPEDALQSVTTTATDNNGRALTLNGNIYFDAFRLWIPPDFVPRSVEDIGMRRHVRFMTKEGHDLIPEPLTTLSGTMFVNRTVSLWPDSTNSNYQAGLFDSEQPEVTLTVTVVYTPAVTNSYGNLVPDPDAPGTHFTANIRLTRQGVRSVPLDEQTISHHDLAVSIHDVRYTPSQVQATICYDVPPGEDWQPVVIIAVDTLRPSDVFIYAITIPPAWYVLPDGTTGLRATVENTTTEGQRQCGTIQAGIPISEAAETLIIGIERFVRPLPDAHITHRVLRDATRFLSERGFEVSMTRHTLPAELFQGGFVEFLEQQSVEILVRTAPDAMLGTTGPGSTERRLILRPYLAANLFAERVNGPWLFTIPLSRSQH